jgi:hypothetical protein
MNGPRLRIVSLVMGLVLVGYGCGAVSSIPQRGDGGQPDAGTGGTATGGAGGAAGHGATAGSGAGNAGGAGGVPLAGQGGSGGSGGAGQAGEAGGKAGGGQSGASGLTGVGGGDSGGHGGANLAGNSGNSGNSGSGGSGAGGGPAGAGGAAGHGGTGGMGGQPGSGGSAGGAAGTTSTGGAGGMTCGFAMPNPVSASLPNPASYDTSTPGVVLDNVTGLAWEQTLSSNSYTQADAAAYCSSNRLGSWSDWRLPSVLELGTLMDFTKTPSDPKIDPVAFPSTPYDNTRASWFQTSTPVAGDAAKSWYVDFQNGNNLINTAGTGRVRCVRVQKVLTSHCYSAGARFVASTTGGITTKLDSATGLVWQQGVGPQLVAWSDGVNYCNGLAGSFRLPSIKEIQTIVDYTVASPGPTIDVAFPATTPASYYYWTSSLLSGVPTSAWLLASDTGSLTWNGQNATYLARCVH